MTHKIVNSGIIRLYFYVKMIYIDIKKKKKKEKKGRKGEKCETMSEGEKVKL